MDNEKKAILQALEESCGVISTACNAIGMPRSTFYNWVNADTQFKEAVNEIQEYALDVAESELHKLIKKGEITAIIFYLKTKGKKRGYIEKNEVDLRTPDGITVNYNRQPGNEPLADANS
ncbi:MAG TPA: helix-turn-helix domain-containing protein [Flavisolibacter sp.]|nr:helix-turn-helix domain-containing protein [Flavisolibacter sp.]